MSSLFQHARRWWLRLFSSVPELPPAAEAPLPEHLNIRTDYPNRWIDRLETAKKDFRPEQSAWAHQVADDSSLEAMLQAERASRPLQAVALYLSWHLKRTSLKPSIYLLSTRRSALDGLVDDVDGVHPVERFDPTHRELATGDEYQCTVVRERIFGDENLEVQPFSREQLIPLIQQLVDGGLLRPQFAPIAQRILEETVAKR